MSDHTPEGSTIMTGPEVLLFVIGGVLVVLAILMIAVTQKKERGQGSRWADYLRVANQANEATAKNNALLEETNQLLRELIKSTNYLKIRKNKKFPTNSLNICYYICSRSRPLRVKNYFFLITVTAV